MSGGTWTFQNKIRPNVYINFEGEGQTVGTVGERGIAAFPAPLPWGKDGVITLNAATYFQDAIRLIGFRAGDPRIRHITAAMNHAQRVLIYRLGANGDKATATIDALTVTAKYAGSRGNDISVSVQADVDAANMFDVVTFLEGEEMDAQKVEKIEDLQPNDYVEFSGTGDFTETAGTNLTGGTDGTTSASDYADALAALETEEFHILGIPSEDDAVKQLAAAYVERLRDSGQKIQAVIPQYAGDSEGIINLRNSIVLADGSEVPIIYVLWEIAAMQAGAAINESLTYRKIPNAVDVVPRLTNAETEDALRNGELVLTARGGNVVIEQDINSLTSFTPTKPYMFSKNRVIRVLDGINNDFVRIFGDFFIGKVPNDDDGRNLFKAQVISYMDDLQNIGAIQNFNAQTDVIVRPGEQIDGVYCEVYIQPVDSLEKFYFNIYVRQGDVSVNAGGAA